MGVSLREHGLLSRAGVAATSRSVAKNLGLPAGRLQRQVDRVSALSVPGLSVPTLNVAPLNVALDRSSWLGKLGLAGARLEATLAGLVANRDAGACALRGQRAHWGLD